MSLGSSVLYRTLSLARLYESRLETLTRLHGQSRARYHVLRAAGSGKAVPSIARQLGCARQSVQKTVDALAESGLVRFAPNPAHRRSPLVRLTDSGALLTERIDQEVRRWESATSACLDAEETEAFLLTLETLRDGLER
jgi:DNA-binding MarR family transcriptional regulator